MLRIACYVQTTEFWNAKSQSFVHQWTFVGHLSNAWRECNFLYLIKSIDTFSCSYYVYILLCYSTIMISIFFYCRCFKWIYKRILWMIKYWWWFFNKSINKYNFSALAMRPASFSRIFCVARHGVERYGRWSMPQCPKDHRVPSAIVSIKKH